MITELVSSFIFWHQLSLLFQDIVMFKCNSEAENFPKFLSEEDYWERIEKELTLLRRIINVEGMAPFSKTSSALWQQV